MDKSYCIYFGEKPFIITNCLNSRLYTLTTQGGTILINQPNAAAINSTIADLDRTNAEAAIILTNQVDLFWKLFCEHFEMIAAGGGLVKNEKGEYLFIFRRGKWDLPKGKLDEGENISACALREVQEETGVANVQMDKQLGSTWHVYHERGLFILKESVWFLMHSYSSEKLVPQTSEDIHDIMWVAPDKLDTVLSNTYPSVKEVMKWV